MGWDQKKIEILKNEWGKGKTALQIAELIGAVSRNAVIGKAHRLNLSSKIKKKNTSYNYSNNEENFDKKTKNVSKKSRFRSLILDKSFEAAKNLSLEELSEETCKYMEGHPNEKDAPFCGRKTVDKFSYCPLHMIVVFTPRNKKDELIEKDEDIPQFIEKKIKSA